MTKRKIYEVSKEESLVPNKDKTKVYPIDVLKEVYIKTDYTIERMAHEFQLPVARIEAIARTGVENWHRLKAEYQETRLQVLSNDFDDLLVEKQSMVQRLEMLTLMDMSARIAEVEAHYVKYGDFFMRNLEGDIVRDGKGQGIRLSLPNSARELLTLKGLEEAKVSNGALLAVRLEEARKASRKRVDGVLDVGQLINGEDDENG